MILSYPGKLYLRKQLKTALNLIKQYIINKTFPNPNIIKLAGFFGPIKKIDYYICFLPVHPDYQERKIGSKLVEYAKMETSKTNCKRIILEVEDKNSLALKFYKSRGFKIIKSTIIKINGEKYYYHKMSLQV
ncbi:MAG: GNAT family N-acetyltransferase [Candidatus Odinarchaeum yellowstonii]|uniref:GNAT family N-acetyltransferase n=1 Tax=Odinarchaeota yellowstonii (strain LCB_4) TaxID=1841599 RepID=A0AAF0D1U7_ODILC|nr:MAG: GNAT family N-acetyltransferase [Candidatus Odinarchaeum yellowstonii]